MRELAGPLRRQAARIEALAQARPAHRRGVRKVAQDEPRRYRLAARGKGHRLDQSAAGLGPPLRFWGGGTPRNAPLVIARSDATKQSRWDKTQPREIASLCSQ